jgi:hypothetical protein
MVERVFNGQKWLKSLANAYLEQIAHLIRMSDWLNIRCHSDFLKYIGATNDRSNVRAYIGATARVTSAPSLSQLGQHFFF